MKVITSPSTGIFSKSLWYAESGPWLSTFNRNLGWYILKRFQQSICTSRLSIDSLEEYFNLGIEVLQAKTECETVQGMFAWGEERNGETIPTSRFGRKPSTMSTFFPAEGSHPHNYTDDRQRLQISELHFDKFPTPFSFSCWKTRFKTQVLVPVHFRRQCYESKKWRCSIQRTIWNHRTQFKGILISRIFNSSRIFISLVEQKLRKRIGSFAQDRSLAWSTTISESLVPMIPFLISLTLFCITLRNDDVQEFCTRWNQILLYVHPRSNWWCLGKCVKIQEHVSLINCKTYWNCPDLQSFCAKWTGGVVSWNWQFVQRSVECLHSRRFHKIRKFCNVIFFLLDAFVTVRATQDKMKGKIVGKGEFVVHFLERAR